MNARTRAAWRRWLAVNHATASGVWLVLHKRSSPAPGLGYEAAVEEALCYGWIDSTTSALDEHRYKLYVAPRRPTSTWAATNKARVEALRKAGKMAAAGLRAVAVAKANGSWRTLDASDRLILPVDLSRAFARARRARARFDAFSPSSRRMILAWIAAAKRPETRARRIAETVALAARNLRATDPRQPTGGSSARSS